jgi:hypothetical protein
VCKHRYRIVVAGVIGVAARQAFGGFKIEQVGADTTQRGDLDQAALFDALRRAFALYLELVEVIREYEAV